jgi:SAM-dependent methyltransferase
MACTHHLSSNAIRSAALCGLVWLLSAAGPARATEEVPFITTPDAVTLTMLRLAGVGPRDVLLDLGSGDGRIPITAARRFGARGLGVELVPELVAQSRRNAKQAGVAARVSFSEQDLFQTDLGVASVITMYLLPDVNLALRPRLLALAPGTRIVSHDWDLGDWLPDQSVQVDVPDKAVGRDKSSRVHLWVVPAQVGGLWCAGAARLQVDQTHQLLSAKLQHRSTTWSLSGRLHGARFSLLGPGGRTLEGHVKAASRELWLVRSSFGPKTTQLPPQLPPELPMRWVPANASGCSA